MAISALLSLVMINKEIYHDLLNLKSYWGEIYLTVEVLTAFIVGGNGLSYLAHLDICANGKRSTNTIRDNSDWTGEYK